MDLKDILNSSANLNNNEIAEIMAAAKAMGMVAQVTFVDNADSVEGQAAVEYVHSHHWLPRNYRTLPRKEVEALGKILFNPKTRLKKKKKALMLLGHRGSIEAYRILKQYVQDSPTERKRSRSFLESSASEGLELKVWADIAFEECKTFLATELSEEIQSGANVVRTKIGRNEPCPCGSEKKYKLCCGALPLL